MPELAWSRKLHSALWLSEIHAPLTASTSTLPRLQSCSLATRPLALPTQYATAARCRRSCIFSNRCQLTLTSFPLVDLGGSFAELPFIWRPNTPQNMRVIWQIEKKHQIDACSLRSSVISVDIKGPA